MVQAIVSVRLWKETSGWMWIPVESAAPTDNGMACTSRARSTHYVEGVRVPHLHVIEDRLKPMFAVEMDVRLVQAELIKPLVNFGVYIVVRNCIQIPNKIRNLPWLRIHQAGDSRSVAVTIDLVLRLMPEQLMPFDHSASSEDGCGGAFHV